MAKKREASRQTEASATPANAPSVTESVRYDTPVKLRAEFKEKLEDVARDLGTIPGALIEQHMGEWIHSEWIRVLRMKLNRAQSQE